MDIAEPYIIFGQAGSLQHDISELLPVDGCELVLHEKNAMVIIEFSGDGHGNIVPGLQLADSGPQ